MTGWGLQIATVRKFGLVMALLFTACIAGAACAETLRRGSDPAIATIRRDLLALLAAPLEEVHDRPKINWIVVDGGDAVTMWHAGRIRGIVVLRLIKGQWWWRSAAVTMGHPYGWSGMSMPGNDVPYCDAALPGSPSAHDLLSQGFIDIDLASRLSNRLPSSTRSDSPIPAEIVLCEPNQQLVKSGGGSYAATFVYKEKYYYQMWLTLSDRAPSGWERSTTPNAHPCYFFTLKAEPKPARYYEARGFKPTPLPSVAAFTGAALDVWFPYVLDRHARYALNLNAADSQIDALPGTLKNNVLHFQLPQFTWNLTHAAYGEIDERGAS